MDRNGPLAPPQKTMAQRGTRDHLAIVLTGGLVGIVLGGLVWLSTYDFLLFHAIVELLAVVVAGTIFSIGWNARKFVENNLLLSLSAGYLVVGAFDALHLLTYQGMGVFNNLGTDVPTQLWVVARWIESAAFLAGAALMSRRPIRAEALLLVNLGVGLLLGSIVFLGDFPSCYTPGVGLTHFKVFSEVGASIAFAVAAVMLWRRRSQFDRTVLTLLLVALGTKILAELAFTSYVSVTGPMNIAGHLLKLVSKGLLYVALVGWSLRQPYETLFKGLAKSEEDLTNELAVRRKTEAALQEAKDAAEAANRAKSDFLANMSHEIRTPMNAVIGMTDLVLETPLQRDQRELLSAARASAGALLDIINDILDFSRIEAGKLELNPAPFDLQEVVEDAVQTIAVRAHEKNLELVCAFDPAVPRVVVGDSGRIRQMLLNILGNAVKFTDRGEVIVRVGTGAHPVPGVGPCVSIAVHDTGLGIPRDKINRLFKSFSQVDGSITRKYGGTGLGLAISKHLAEQMGGSIEVESVEGQGSTFSLLLPLEVAPTQPASAPPFPSESPPRVLVVDDSSASRDAIVEALCAAGASAQGAPGGSAALDSMATVAAQGRAFDIVMIDTEMPAMDGYATIEKLRADPLLSRTHVVMMTSASVHCDRAACEHGSVGRCLIKPAKRAVLLQTVQAVLSDTALGSSGYRGPLRLTSTDDSNGAPSGARTCDRGHLLLAEDNVVNQRFVEVLLSRRGWLVTSVGTGDEAVQALACARFDAVLMDVQMPGCDGLEATRRIREAERRSGGHVPIIGLTAHAMKSDAERCIQAGMDAYLSKPIDIRALESALEPMAAGSGRIDDRCPHVGIDGLSEMVGGDQSAIQEIVQTFLDDYPDKLRGIAEGIEQGDPKAVERFAHSLKGAVSLFGAGVAGGIAAELERMGRDRRIEEAAGAFGRLQDEMANVRRDLIQLQDGARLPSA